MTKYNVCFCYIGSYESFDSDFKTHTQHFFNELDKNTEINYHVFANINTSINYRMFTNNINVDKVFNKYFLSQPELKQHVPNNYVEVFEKEKQRILHRWDNYDKNPYFSANFDLICDNIYKNNSNFFYDSFKEKFGDKLKLFINEPSYNNNIYFIHDLKHMTQNLPFLRNKALSEYVRKYEKDNNINYDVIICLRPDLYINSHWKEWDYIENGHKIFNINEIIYNIINNKKKCYSGISNHGSSRYDVFFISKYFISELINEDIIDKKLKDANFYEKIKKLNNGSEEILSMESFVDEYLKPIKFISPKISKYLDYMIYNELYPKK